MSEHRDYPPAVMVHHPNCPDIATIRKAGIAVPEMATRVAAARYPNGVMHRCYHFNRDPLAAIEIVSYEPHPYRPSSIQPEDATKPLCADCRGTHGVADLLYLPPDLR